MKYLLLLCISVVILSADTWSVVYISKEMKLKKSDIINIYFKRLKQKNGHSIIAVNLHSSHPARLAFMKKILNSNLVAWGNYYDELYFRGIRSPLVLKSEKSILQYLKNIDGVVAYIPSSKVDKNCIVLTKFEL